MPFVFPPTSTCLLDSHVIDFLIRNLAPGRLFTGVELLLSCLILVVAIIYIYLWVKKKYFLTVKRLSHNLEVWLTGIVMDESEALPPIPGKLRRALKNKHTRQFIIDELVRFKKNLAGEASAKISVLYEQWQLKNDSIHKLKSSQWHIRAKGIQELYLMHAKDVLNQISPFTNSRNDYVRMEAQTGVVYLTGFEGLQFLDDFTLPLTDWQQLKLLEQLRQAKNKSGLADNIIRWLHADNDTVIIFALKLAGEYQVFEASAAIKALLKSANEKVRAEAIKVLIKLAEDDYQPLLLDVLTNESPGNQLIILDTLTPSISESDKQKLIRLLDSPDNLIKLHAAISLVRCNREGMQVLKERALLQPEPFNRIVSHIQSVSVL
ncbi:MAG TPA: HEAT repeat domain-containing protein [Sediminibacterium sp.]|nr:HEAT repeat domain-containing protein [Sediminibacterium sp.]